MQTERIYLQRRNKSGIYYLVIVNKINEKRTFKKVSCHTKYKNEALTFLKHYEKNKESQVMNPHLKISDIKSPILDYVSSNLSNASLEKYELTIRTLLIYWGDKEVNSVNIKDVEHLKSSLCKKMRKESVNIYVRYIKAIWNLLIRLGYTNHNALSNIRQFKTHEKEIVSFTDEEITRILKEINDEKYRMIVLLATETGLRISELLNLKVSNLDLENSLIKICNDSEFKTKSRKNRIIPFNETINVIITNLLRRKSEASDHLITRIHGLPYKRDYITRYFRNILDKLGFDDRYHFHSLRATFIMRLVRKGVNPIFIQRLAGHSTLTVTQRYCFVRVSDLREAINK